MKFTRNVLTFWALFSCMTALVCQGAVDKKTSDDVNAAIADFKTTDPGMKTLFDEAAGYVVFPSIMKGGFLVGAAHGEGLVFEKGKLIGKGTLTQVTVGAQVGGQEFEEIIFFQTKEALDRFKQSNLEMSAQISAVVAAEGASQNARYINGVLIFTKAKTGLMAEASVGGQKLKFEPIQESR